MVTIAARAVNLNDEPPRRGVAQVDTHEIRF
jgi:hypothetical protein